jgi:hypothetical protein
MYKAAHHYETRTQELGLLRLSTVLKHMGNCVNQELGNSNKTLFVQFYRTVSIELAETKAALLKYKDDNKALLEPPAIVKEEEATPLMEEFKVPERKDSDEK